MRINLIIVKHNERKGNMADIDAERLRQLNERSRFYTRHIWQVPFAYVAVIAWTIEKVPLIKNPYYSSLLMIGLGIFSLSVLVFVVHMKYYERRAVKALQEFEQEKGINRKAGGASPWYMSFAWYIRLMLLIAVVAFFLLGFLCLPLPDSWWKLVAILLVACLLAVLLGAILIYDRKRSSELISGIREQMSSQQSAAPDRR